MSKQEPKEYNLPPNISIANLIEVMRHLKDDAGDKFSPLAKSYTLYGSPDDKAKALFYAGQVELLSSMLWALSGVAEEDGLEPTISIAIT